MTPEHYVVVKQGYDAISKWRAEHPTDILDLRGADLSGADLSYADLRGANLRGATLRDATLRYAGLSGADLRDADLIDADLQYAFLHGADLSGADLQDTIGNSREIKTIQTDRWTVTYTAKVMQIGCQRHAIEDWWDFDDTTISIMESKALEWWKAWKPILQQIIATSPATQTNNKED